MGGWGLGVDGEGDTGRGEEDDMLSVLLSRQPCALTLTQSNILEPFTSPLKKNNSFLPPSHFSHTHPCPKLQSGHFKPVHDSQPGGEG